MKLRAFSPILFVAACSGGSNRPDIILPDAPDTSFSNSNNDMLYASFGGDMLSVQLTPQDDSPDNQGAALTITSTGGKRISGEMGIGGDTGDDYSERDTFLITTGADVNQMTIRLAWDGESSDHDFFLFEELAPGGTADDLVQVAGGTLISNVNNEFQTFVVKPNTNYWLWAAVFGQNADDGLAPGGEPLLPQAYDLSVYGEALDTLNVGACSFTEAADGTNDTLSEGATGTAEASGQTLATASHVFCGTLNDNFVADAMDPTFGVVDVDTFGLTVGLETPVVATLVGATLADQTALAAMLQVEYLILDKDGAFFERGFFINTHGTFTTTLPTTIDDEGMDTGPRSIAILAFDAAAPAADINYKLKLSADLPDTRAPRLTGASDLSEANDTPRD